MVPCQDKGQNTCASLAKQQNPFVHAFVKCSEHCTAFSLAVCPRPKTHIIREFFAREIRRKIKSCMTPDMTFDRIDTAINTWDVTVIYRIEKG